MNLLLKILCGNKNDLLSGLTVALALVPEAVAFAFVAGVNPLVGLYAAFSVGFIAAIVGGRPGMISGATGALAVVMVSLVANHGVEYIFITVILMGTLQILAGLLRLGKFIRMVPQPAMMGFVNGLAIVIFLAQLQHFKIRLPNNELIWMESSSLITMFGLVGLTMLIVKLLPKLTRAIPSSLVAIFTITILVAGLGIDTIRVGDLASIAGGFPSVKLPNVSYEWSTLKIIFPYAVLFAAIGLIETLLTLQLIDAVTKTTGKSNRECIGQGCANIASGFLGGMGGCAMIGQSMININSGGHGRLSGITASVCLLCFILFASPLIEQIPIAALVGVMFVVVISTFEWSSFRVFNKMPWSDSFVLVMVSAVTVVSDLAIAVVFGVIISALVYAWKSACHINVRIKDQTNNTRIYELHGPLFFSSVHSFMELFTPNEDPNDVIIDFRYTRVHDYSGLQAIDNLASRYIEQNKNLHLIHLSPECKALLHKAGELVEVNLQEDPNYHVASDKIL